MCMLFVVWFFFASRRRHKRCALVTGVQTCALPICGRRPRPPDFRGAYGGSEEEMQEPARIHLGSARSLHIAAFGRDMHGQPVEIGGQQYLARQAARPPPSGGKVEHILFHLALGRSEERRVRKEWVRTGRARGAAETSTKK